MRGEHVIHDKDVAFAVVETHSGISIASPDVLHNVVRYRLTITKVGITWQVFLGEQFPQAFLCVYRECRQMEEHRVVEPDFVVGLRMTVDSLTTEVVRSWPLAFHSASMALAWQYRMSSSRS